MSKKLIAVASAAALALTALVGIAPANATVTLALIDAETGTGTSADPYVELVPTTNLIIETTSIGFNATTIAGDVMTVTATGSVRILPEETGSDADNLFTSASGTTTYTVTATGATTQFVVYNTTTTAGTFTVSLKSATSSATGSPVYVKGAVGTAYNYNVTAPASIAAGAAGEITFTVTDMFGNAIESGQESTILNASSVAGAGAPALGLAVSWDTSRKVFYLSIAAQATPVPFGYTLNVTGISDVGGLAKAKDSFYAAINSPAAATANAAATAQVAALTAQLAASRPIATSVTKKKYNTLARKWNRAFPSQKVALKK
jgi:hypothetical protein